MPEPKPPEGYDNWLDAILTSDGGVFSEYVGPLEYARAELDNLRADAEKWRATKPVLKTFLLEFIAKLEPYWDDDDA